MFFNKRNKTRITLPMKSVKKTPESFSDLPSKEKRKIIEKAAREANQEQLELHQKAGRVCI